MTRDIDAALEHPDVRWVVAYVGGWKPREVVDYLWRVGFCPYAPQEIRVQMNARVHGSNAKRERKIVTKNLFGGYLFVGQPNPAHTLSTDTHPRIFDILGDSAGPFYLAQEALQAIRKAELEGEWDYSRDLSQRLPVGRRVTINQGHYADFQAVVALVERSGKVRLKINLFGREVETVVDASRVVAA